MRNVKKIILGLVIVAVSFGIIFRPQSASAAFGYYRTITIDHTKVPSTQSSFTVMVCANLTLGNGNTCGTVTGLNQSGGGAKVLNANGYDIVFSSSDSTCQTNVMHWEMPVYTASTGEMVSYVLITSLSTSIDTTIYMCYGNSGISSFQGGASSGVWDSNYLGVWHLQGTSALTDSIGSNNGTNHSATTDSSGMFSKSVTFASSGSQYIDLASSGNDTSSGLTYEIWYKPTSTTAEWLLGKTVSGVNGISIASLSGSSQECYSSFQQVNAGTATVQECNSPSVASQNTWNQLTIAMTNPPNSSSNAKTYLNGGLATLGPVGVQTFYFAGALPNNAVNIIIGNSQESVAYFDGSLAEVRVSNTMRSADWITTGYNNQSTPGTFESFGTENAEPGIPTTPNTTIGTTGSMFIDSKASVFIQN